MDQNNGINLSNKSTNKNSASILPKKPLCSYIIFAMHQRQIIKQQHPNMTFGKISKEIGRRWAKAGLEVKMSYKLLEQKAKAKYRTKMQEIGKSKQFPNDFTENKPRPIWSIRKWKLN